MNKEYLDLLEIQARADLQIAIAKASMTPIQMIIKNILKLRDILYFKNIQVVTVKLAILSLILVVSFPNIQIFGNRFITKKLKEKRN